MYNLSEYLDDKALRYGKDFTFCNVFLAALVEHFEINFVRI